MNMVLAQKTNPAENIRNKVVEKTAAKRVHPSFEIAVRQMFMSAAKAWSNVKERFDIPKEERDAAFQKFSVLAEEVKLLNSY
jgi:hypothetical protein